MSRVGVAFFNEGREARGYDLELVQELARRLGCQLTIVEMNRARIVKSLEQGELIDLATSNLRTAERDQTAQFVPMALTRDYLLVPSRLAKPGFDLGQFIATPGLRLGVLTGSSYSSPMVARNVAALARQGRTEPTSQAESLIPRLLAGRYDGLITTPAYFVTLSRFAGGADIRALPILEGEPFLAGIYLSRKTLSEGRRQQIRETLRAIHQDGTLLRILLRYFPEAMARERVGFKDEAS